MKYMNDISGTEIQSSYWNCSYSRGLSHPEEQKPI